MGGSNVSLMLRGEIQRSRVDGAPALAERRAQRDAGRRAALTTVLGNSSGAAVHVVAVADLDPATGAEHELVREAQLHGIVSRGTTAIVDVFLCAMRWLLATSAIIHAPK